jgi:beta-phosphoglucomutase-like phosphatase (HAD superfamily)
MYLGAASYLGLQPSEVAMVASHVNDLRSATKYGLKTVYIPRSTEDAADVAAAAKAKKDGGEFDVVIKSFVELGELFKARGPEK